MEQVRQFRLTNSLGQSFDLMLTRGLTSNVGFFNKVGGLGITRKDKFLNLGNRYVRVNKEISQGSITGNIAFVSDPLNNRNPYLYYSDFVQFIASEPLTIHYTPVPENGVEYRADVVIKKLGKTEINQVGYLDCAIEFAALTPWYKTVTYDYFTGAGLMPSNSLNPANNLTPRDSSIRTINYNCQGTLISPVKLKIYGPITNPYWTYTTTSGTYEGRLTTSISSSQMIIVDATSDTYTISRAPISNESNITNIYTTSDYSTRRFVEFERGSNTFRLYAEGQEYTNRTRVILEIMECYETV